MMQKLIVLKDERDTSNTTKEFNTTLSVMTNPTGRKSVKIYLN